MPWYKSTKNRFDSRFCLQQVSSVAQQGGIDKLTPIKVDAVDFCGDGKQRNKKSPLMRAIIVGSVVD